MTRETKALVWSSAIGLALGLTLCVLFGVLDVQCYGSAKQNWNAALQTCE